MTLLFATGTEYIVTFRERGKAGMRTRWYAADDTDPTARRDQARKFPTKREAVRFAEDAKKQSVGYIFEVEPA